MIIIDLTTKIRPLGRMTLLRAEIASFSETQFACLIYSIDGAEQPLGLRMDLNKRVLLDSVNMTNMACIAGVDLFIAESDINCSFEIISEALKIQSAAYAIVHRGKHNQPLMGKFTLVTYQSYYGLVAAINEGKADVFLSNGLRVVEDIDKFQILDIKVLHGPHELPDAESSTPANFNEMVNWLRLAFREEEQRAKAFAQLNQVQPSETTDHTYLGDGVYASYDGYQVWLTTDIDHGIDSPPNNAIAIDPSVLTSLNRYYQLLAERSKHGT